MKDFIDQPASRVNVDQKILHTMATLLFHLLKIIIMITEITIQFGKTQIKKEPFQKPVIKIREWLKVMKKNQLNVIT